MVNKKLNNKQQQEGVSFNLKPTTAAVRLALTGMLASSIFSPVQAELPVAAANWVHSKDSANMEVIGNKLQINQLKNKVTLNWKSFNIGVNNHVNFTQPNASSIALNRIGQNDPSRILGKLTANGQIYLINQNGFIFGKNSIINVASLVASTHNISDEAFNKGITEIFDKSKSGDAAFELKDAFKLDAKNNKILKKILIEKGANIIAGDNGNIIIVAPEIENNGTIQTGDFGQIILVSSQDKVYLQQADSDSFKRLLVEVDTGGKVSNFGDLITKQGDITMAGFMVNQSGRVNATTASTINGTVHLLAREGHQKLGNKLIASRTTRNKADEDGLGQVATVTLAGTTAISADSNAGTDVDGQNQPQSVVDISAHTVVFKSSSRIVAPDAQVNVMASDNVNSPLTGTSGHIVVEKGGVIDVSGVKGVAVSLQRNIGEVDAISSLVLRDSPNQRGGILAGEKLAIDLRKETKIVDVTGAKKIIQRSVTERLAKGGDITLTASGDIDIQNGAFIDISGGSVNYQDGYITTTQIVNQFGRQFDISDANPDDKFIAIFNQTHFEKGYTEGKDAGSLTLKTKSLNWDGSLAAQALNGRYQRTEKSRAVGGGFSVDLAAFNSFQNLAFQNSNALTQLALSGLQSFSLKTRGQVLIAKDANLNFSPFSNVSISAQGIQHQGQIYTAGGDINFDVIIGSIELSSGSVLDVSGRWVNDNASLLRGQIPTEAIAIDGGNISLISKDKLIAAKGARIYADGGGRLSSFKKLTSGLGGSIDLTASSSVRRTQLSFAGADISAKSLSKNGRLNLSSNQFEIDNKTYFDTQTGVNHIAAGDALFSTFYSVSLKAKSDITLTELANIDLRQNNLQVNGSYIYQQSSQSIKGITNLVRLPEYTQSSTKFSLFAGNNIKMLNGSSIISEARSEIAMTANKKVFVDGVISAPAGKINLKIAALNSGRFEADQSVWLGKHANLSVKGTINLDLDPNFRTGTVLAGGDINLEAQRGFMVVEQGAKIDVSGSAAALDVAINGLASNGYQHRVIGSDGGSINVIAAEGIALEGDMQATAGSHVNFAGSLSVELSRGNQNLPVDPADSATFPTGPLVISISQQSENIISNKYHFGDALNGALPGQANVYADKLKQAGFGSIAFKTEDTIQFKGGVDLSTQRALSMDASSIAWVANTGQAGNMVNLKAPHLAMGSSLNQQVVGASVLGDGVLNFQSEWMQLFGAIKVNGAKQLSLTSHNDIQLVANHLSNVNDFAGELVTAANLNLTASKIYPSSLSHYRLVVENNPEGTINISSTDGNKATPLSAGGELTLQAKYINQGGTLLAPLGQINLEAEKTLKLADGSVTSVSAEGLLIPLGNVVDGLDWLYPLALNVLPELSSGNLLFGLNTNLDKKILLKSPDIVKQKNAVVDLAGGGDIFSYEFIPGLGGSYDYLQPSKKGNGSYKGGFAILPTLGTSFAPIDHYQSKFFNFAAGETVVLNGTNGLPSGEFAKLPAHYALLPGAYLVTPISNTLDQGQTTQTIDGRAIVSGYSSIAGTAKGGGRFSGYMLENGAQVRKQSEYVSYTGDKFLLKQALKNETRTPTLARDGGLVSIQAQTRLIMDGVFNVQAVNGIGAKMDIAADNIRVMKNLSGVQQSGVLEILASNLTGLNVSSLLLGGERKAGDKQGETAISVSSKTISIEEGSVLDVADLIVAAKDSVTVKKGATVAASSFTNSGDKLLSIDGDGALLRVSGSEQVDFNRTASSGVKGTLSVEDGAILSAKRSILLDSSLSTDVSGEIKMESGSLNLSANNINIGEVTSGISTNVLNLSNAALTKMSLDELVLTSRNAINFYGSTGQLDTNGVFQQLAGGQINPLQISRLSINATGITGQAINGNSATDSVNIKVKELELKNTLNAINSLPATGAGIVNIEADNMLTGDGKFAIDGFNKVNMVVNKQLTAEGVGSLDVNADLEVKTPVLTARSRGDYQFNAKGHSAVFNGMGVKGVVSHKDLTGKLSVTADKVTVNTRVDIASGVFDVTALKADVVIGDQAVIDLSGREFNFADITKNTTGGNLNLRADKGDIHFYQGSSVNLNAGGNSQQGGHLKLQALNGNAFMQGNYQAHGGSVDIDVSGFQTQSNFDTLFGALTNAGVTKSIDYRSAKQDITVSAGNSVVAEYVKLAADNGAVIIAGIINADAKENSRIELIAGKELILTDTAELTAQTNTDKKGGKVLLSTTDTVKGGIKIQTASVINVGNQSDEKGTVILRAPRLDTDNNGTDDSINITQVAGSINGVTGGGFYAEGVKIYTDVDGNITSADTAKYKNDASAYMSVTRVDGLNSNLKLRPGIEVQYDGNLNVLTAIDTVNWRYFGDTVGQLALRATGDINVKHSISDGYKARKLQKGNSWSLVMASGADLSSADLSAVLDRGDINLGNNVTVRTGNGNISMFSAGDVNFASQTSVIYNMGRQDVESPYGPVRGANRLGYEYPVNGGDIEIVAGGNINGAQSRQFINQWLIRKNKIGRGGAGIISWGVKLNSSAFQQNIGSFGGGNVTLASAGDINNLSIMMPTTGKPQSKGNAPIEFGGGNMQVFADGNISGGAYYTGKGKAELRAGKSIKGGAKFTNGPVIAMGDSQFKLTAGDDIHISSVIDPMILHDKGVNFFSYTNNSAISLSSLSGDIYLSANNGSILQQQMGSQVYKGNISGLYPGILNATAANGSILLKNDISLFPSTKGQLNLLAEYHIRPVASNGSRVNIAMSDADASKFPRAVNAVKATDLNGSNSRLNPFNFQLKSKIHATVSPHNNSSDPVRLIAKKGNIESLQMNFPKRSIIEAGKDYTKNKLYIQHVNNGDYSVISAGRDLTSASGRDLVSGAKDSNNDSINIAGPGDVLFKTGRNLDLGRSEGIVSVGNQLNPQLATDAGANLTFLVGVPNQPEYIKFIQQMNKFRLDNAGNALTQSRLFKVIEVLAGYDDIKSIDSATMNKLIMPLFFTALKEGGKAESLGNVLGNKMGFQVIETLFPEHKAQGDLKMFFSSIQTQNGGDINIAVPGGGVNVGLASSSDKNATEKKTLGILALGEGEINTFLRDNLDVNQSRMFTLGGEDILVWSSEGDIDAGKGAKAAFSTLPPQFSYVDDKVVVEPQPNVAGSGINADFKALSANEITNLLRAQTDKSKNSAVSKLAVDIKKYKNGEANITDAIKSIRLAIAPKKEITTRNGLQGIQGSGFLFAPKGIINASEAGISANNLFIVAKAVLGANNISISGTSVGVSSDTGSVAPVTGLSSNTAASVSKAAEKSVQNNSSESDEKQIALGMLSVDVVGFGSEDGKQACQKTKGKGKGACNS